jgi:hypothetical protein
MKLEDFYTRTPLPIPVGKVSLTSGALKLMRLIADLEKTRGEGVDFIDLLNRWEPGARSLKTLARRYGYDSGMAEPMNAALWFQPIADEQNPEKVTWVRLGLTQAGYAELSRVAAKSPHGGPMTAAHAQAAKDAIDVRPGLSKRSKAALKAHVTRNSK